MIAILDVDGTCLQWREVFESWAIQRELISQTSEDCHNFLPGKYNFPVEIAIKMFNESHFIQHLPPVPGAIKAVKALHKNGYQLKINSSFSTNFAAHKMRETNLKNVFGDIFSEMNFVGFKGFDYVGEKVEFVKQNNHQHLIVFDDNFYVLDEIIRLDLVDPRNCFFHVQPYNVKYTDRLQKFNVQIGRWKDFLSTIDA